MKVSSLFNRTNLSSAALVALACILFFANINHEPLWLDETYSASMAAHGPMDIIRYVQDDVHPPLYYLLLHGMTRLVGNTPLGLRMLSVLFGVGLVALGVGPLARLTDRRTGLLFSTLVMFSPALICFSQETRMYSMAAFLLTGATLYGYLAYQKGKPKDFVLFSIFLVTGMYTHYYALLALVLLCAGLLGLSFFRQRDHRRAMLIAIACGALAYLPWIPSFIGQIERVREGFWIPPTNLFIFEYALFMPFSFKVEDIPYFKSAWLAMGMVLIMSALAIRHKRRSEAVLPFTALTLGTYFGMLAAGLLISYIVAPVLMPRYMVVGAGLFFIPAAIGIAALANPIVRYGIIGLLITLMLPADIVILSHTFNGPFKALSAHIEKHSDETVPIIHEDYQTVLPLWHRTPNRPHYLLVPRDDTETRIDDVHGRQRPTVIRNIDEVLGAPRKSNSREAVLRAHRTAWLVNSDMADTLDNASLQTLDETKKRFELPYSFVKVTLEQAIY